VIYYLSRVTPDRYIIFDSNNVVVIVVLLVVVVAAARAAAVDAAMIVANVNRIGAVAMTYVFFSY
jgi:multisubunit Na+/H+ antiporter MnhF subunit